MRAEEKKKCDWSDEDKKIECQFKCPEDVELCEEADLHCSYTEEIFCSNVLNSVHFGGSACIFCLSFSSCNFVVYLINDFIVFFIITARTIQIHLSGSV